MSKLSYATLGFYLLICMVKIVFHSRRMLQEMKRLNEVIKQEAFNKLLVTTLGVDTTAEAANILIGTGARALSHRGNAGNAAGFYVNTIGGEYVAIASDYSKQVAYLHVLFCRPRKCVRQCSTTQYVAVF